VTFSPVENTPRSNKFGVRCFLSEFPVMNNFIHRKTVEVHNKQTATQEKNKHNKAAELCKL